MPQAVVIATGNAGKVSEFCAILKDSAFSFFASKDIGFSEEVEETAQTFRGNAEIKAKAVFEYISSKDKYRDYWVVADDSGLEVEALNGAPGVFSARYAGENASGRERYTKLLKELEGKANRKARFICCLCLMRSGKPPEFFEGECRGSILTAPRGEGGFGYDPVFLPDGYDRGFGEMSEEEKNVLSHRGRAIKNMLAGLGTEALL
ncbi:MAG: RdgB/HAM1 family non-canonical purine NTP pyrophosphatase [Fibromonadaceae bacterium]|jgi:XTP/dITP diphosphohydrolase|nr:RdgB/HAM1 family non-canonical purine NTP pyrophosphatase [Fibromonadaceae bacterium]